MKIIFYSHDDSIERMVKSLGGELFFIREDHQVLEVLEDVNDDEDCLLFLDMDIGKKQLELFNKSLVQNEWLYRIIISGEMTVKEFKKHQKGKTAAHGYVSKPLTTSIFKGILNDLEIGHLISEGDLYEEGQSLPSLPDEPKSVTGWTQSSSDDEDYFEEEGTGTSFEAAEFKMNTQVRKLVDLHSVNGDRPPYEGELNEKIQRKFDQVFGESDTSFSTDYGNATQESIDLRQVSSSDGGPSLDLSLGEEATELKMDDDLGLEDSITALDASDALGLDLDEEIDLEEELNFEESNDRLDFEEEVESEIDLEEGGSDENALDLLDELDELTANRKLPSKEELSEFEEVTGDIVLPEGEELSMAQDENDDLDLDLDELQGDEDDALEFDGTSVEDVLEEGELSFSDNEEDDFVSSGTDDGEMDFSLGEDEDGQLDLSEESLDLGEGAALVAEDIEESGDLDFSMDEPSDAGMSSSNELAIKEEASTSSFSGDELNFDDDDDEIEKTMAINISEIEKGGINLEKAFEDDFDLESGSSLDVESEVDESDESFDIDDNEEESTTNPTMVMSQEMTQDLENMIDEDKSTKEFRPGSEDEDLSVDDFEDDDEIDIDASEDADLYEVEEDIFDTEDQTVEFSNDMESDEYEDDETVESSEPIQASRGKNINEGHLSITAEEDRIPPSFNESEAIRLQATIRQLREEREHLLKDISDLNRDKKLTDQDNLGLKAELDEAKIEISILKKRHSNETDEMKYRLRLSDEKKLFAEEKARTLQKEFDRLQQKVRIDFNQIKQREKELEGQLELVKMDSEGQVQSRDKKILDLKRKIDQLEFNMENVVIREQKSRDDKLKVEDRLERIMKTLRGSIEVLEDDMDWQDDKRKT